MKTISCMNIDESLLYSMSAEDRNYKKRESVFKKKDSRIIRLSKNIFFEMTDGNPVRRLKGLPDYLKSCHYEDCLKWFQIELTRQQIANLTGLSVETLNRTLIRMEKADSIIIKYRKILY